MGFTHIVTCDVDLKLCISPGYKQCCDKWVCKNWWIHRNIWLFYHGKKMIKHRIALEAQFHFQKEGWVGEAKQHNLPKVESSPELDEG